MIVGSMDTSTAIERLQGYREALEGAGIAYRDDLVLPGNHREEGGRVAAHTLLSRPADQRSTALFVGNNEMTIGALLAARELEIHIPVDLSIVGFDDSRWARLMRTVITVAAQPAYELAYLACETLLHRLENGFQSSGVAKEVEGSRRDVHFTTMKTITFYPRAGATCCSV